MELEFLIFPTKKELIKISLQSDIFLMLGLFLLLVAGGVGKSALTIQLIQNQ